MGDERWGPLRTYLLAALTDRQCLCLSRADASFRALARGGIRHRGQSVWAIGTAMEMEMEWKWDRPTGEMRPRILGLAMSERRG
jgi:hypothetical protein